MKIARRYYQGLTKLLLVASLISYACSDDNDALPAPEVVAVDPTVAPKGTKVTIAGSGFGIDTSQVSVTFNNKAAKLVSLTNNIIEVIVPDRAGDGKVTVTVRGSALSNQPAFTYKLSVSTFTGNGNFGTQDGPPAIADFLNPYSLFIAPDSKIYVADYKAFSIRVVSPEGNVSTLVGKYTVGYKDGALDIAAFNGPYDMVMDQQKNLYVTDLGNNMIRKIDVNGTVTTLAGNLTAGATDGTGGAAKFSTPTGIAIDKNGVLYVADRANSLIRKVTPAGVVTTLAGNGTAGFADGMGTAAKFNLPTGIAVDATGNIFVGDTQNNRIRKITPDGLVSTFAGNGEAGFADGTSSSSKFNNPFGLAFSSDGTLYVADSKNASIRMISSDGNVSTLTGGKEGFDNGAVDVATFRTPHDVDIAPDGTIYIIDQFNNCVRKVD